MDLIGETKDIIELSKLDIFRSWRFS